MQGYRKLQYEYYSKHYQCVGLDCTWMFLPRMHNRFYLSVYVCVFVSTKIARSGDLGVIAKCKYHYSIGKIGKLTFFCLLDA